MFKTGYIFRSGDGKFLLCDTFIRFSNNFQPNLTAEYLGIYKKYLSFCYHLVFIYSTKINSQAI